MKKLLYVALLFPFLSLAQWNNDNPSLHYENVFESNQSKSEIKADVNEWIAISFNDANHVIKMNTEDKIIANGQFPVSFSYNSYPMSHDIGFSLIAEFKDGRFKVTAENIINISSGYPVQSISMSFEDYKAMVKEQAEDATGQTRKILEKQLNNDSKMRKDYDSAIGLQNDITQKSKEEIEGMIRDLVAHVGNSETKKDDW